MDQTTLYRCTWCSLALSGLEVESQSILRKTSGSIMFLKDGTAHQIKFAHKAKGMGDESRKLEGLASTPDEGGVEKEVTPPIDAGRGESGE